jgi:hypothetical protein
MSAFTAFRNLFDGLDRTYGKYDIDHDLSSRREKVTGKPVTIKAAVTMELYAKHLEGEQGLGIVPIREDSTCNFAALDIDEYNLDLPKLAKEIAEKSLPLVVCRSKSGGAHCYMFMEEPIRADIVFDKMKTFGAALGYPSIEIFPKQKSLKPNDVGNWINLPYFDCQHSETDRYAFDREGEPIMKLEDFVEYADNLRVTLDQLKGLKPKKKDMPFDDGPPCLQRLASQGFPDGTRNNGLFNLGVYCRKKFGDEGWDVELSAMNLKYMQPPLGHAEVGNVIKSAGRKEYQYTCDQPPINSVCSKDACYGKRFGVGNGGGAGNDPEMMLGGLRKSVTRDLYGEEIQEDEVMWFMDVDGVEIQLSTMDLFSQDRFRAKCAERLCKLPMKVRPQRWDLILADKIENAGRVEFPPETGTYGQIASALRDFIVRFGGAEERLDILAGKVWEDDNGFLWFQHEPFWKFLCKQGIYRVSDNGKQLHTIMKKLGAEKKDLKVDSAQNIVRSCWSLKDFTGEDPMPNVKTPKTPY